jgi:hypothetical protein
MMRRIEALGQRYIALVALPLAIGLAVLAVWLAGGAVRFCGEDRPSCRLGRVRGGLQVKDSQAGAVISCLDRTHGDGRGK